MLNPIIVSAVILQVLIAMNSRIAGAIIGYLITTGVLVWGMVVYAQGNQMAWLGAPLSEQVFIIACLVWYCFDTKEYITARKLSHQSTEVIEQPTSVDELTK